MEAEKENKKIEADQFFYASWGYDQTNIDFIKVVAVSPTGKTVIAQRAHGVRVEEGSGRGYDALVPGEPFGLEFRLRVRDVGADQILRGKYPFCGDADPTALRTGSFYLWNGNAKSQTAAGWGH